MGVSLLAPLLLSVVLTWIGYRSLQQGAGLWPPAAARGVAWLALGALLFNVGCPVAPGGGTVRPLVLLDASLSMRRAGADPAAAAALAKRLGEVRLFGDPDGARGERDTVFGVTRLGPALAAAQASGRPVIVVTDGEVEDAARLPPELLARTTVRRAPRDTLALRDIEMTAVHGPDRLVTGDTARFEIDLRSTGFPLPHLVTVTLTEGTTRLLARRVTIDGGGTGRGVLQGVLPLAPGTHLLTLSLTDTLDRETRNNTRWHLLAVRATPGIVLASSPTGWEGRFLSSAIRDVSALPTRGFQETAPGRWHRVDDFTEVTVRDVEAAVRRADLAVLVGSGAARLRGTEGARAVWRWGSEPNADQAAIEGDWYLGVAAPSPVAGALAGLIADSFPPATRLRPMTPAGEEPGGWDGLTATLGRRGAVRSAMIGRLREGGRRDVTMGVDGLWRWAFRGGASQDAYRALVAAVVSWLVDAPDSARGAVTPVRPVVPRATPIVFQWHPGDSSTVAILETVPLGEEGVRRAARIDTLTRDGRGQARLGLPVGAYRYRLASGGAGTVAVEPYSSEWFPAPRTLDERPATLRADAIAAPARAHGWLVALAVLAFLLEWYLRRRRGLR